MSGFRGGPNVSQYIANLNSVRGHENSHAELGNLDEDLAYFTNAELFDFDLSNGDAQIASTFKEEAKPAGGDDVAVNFDYFEPNSQPLGSLNTQFASTSNFDPQLYHSPQSATFPSQQVQQQQQQQPSQDEQQPQPSVEQASSVDGTAQAAGTKRSHSSASPSAVEEAARMAAEEDKRRRNTAASARFRVKKKQREAALEKTAKDMTEKVDQLQKRVSELEMENKWLRGLVVEKGMKMKTEDGVSDGNQTATADRIADKQIKKGVGTKTDTA